MKIKNILIGLSLITVLMTPACEPFSLKQDDLQLSADLSIFNSYFSIRYLDAATGNVIGLSGDADFAVDLSCSTSNLIVNTDGEYTKSMALRFGFFTLALNPYIPVPTPENPATVTIRTRSGKYLESTTTIELTGERAITFEVPLINLSNPPSGIKIETFNNIGEASAAGEVSSAITIAASNESASMEIPAGTILKDENGAPLSGRLSARMITVDAYDSIGYQAMPGLFEPLLTQEGIESEMTDPLGNMDVEIQDATGKIAASATGREVQIVTKLEAGDLDPEAEDTINVGDKIPAYTFDSESGIWNYAGIGEVMESENGLVIRTAIAPLKGGSGNRRTFRVAVGKEAKRKLDIKWTSSVAFENANARIKVGISKIKKYKVINKSIATSLNGGAGTIQLKGMPRKPNSGDYVRLKVTSNSFYSSNKLILRSAESNGKYRWNLAFSPSNPGNEAVEYPVNLKLILCGGIVLDGAKIPDFSVTISGPGYAGQQVINVTGGIMNLPADPTKITAPWKVKIIYKNTKVYPTGSELESVNADQFRIVGSGSETKYYFDWTVTDPAECAELKSVLGIN
jgi:hypothetical protein